LAPNAKPDRIDLLETIRTCWPRKSGHRGNHENGNDCLRPIAVISYP